MSEEVDGSRTGKDPKRIFLALLTIGVASRLIALGNHSLWYDEGAVLYVAKSAEPLTILEDSRHPPLAFLALQVWIGIFGEASSVVRLLPALLSCVSLVLLSKLARLWLDPLTAAVAVAIYAVAPFQNWYAHEIAPYAFLEFGSNLTLLAAAVALPKAKPSPVALAGVAVGTAIAFGSQYMGFSIGASVAALAALHLVKRMTSVKGALSVVAASVLGGLVWLPWILTKLPRQMSTTWGDQAKVGPRQLLEVPIRLLLIDSSVMPPAMQWFGYILGGVLWIGILLCAWSAVKRKHVPATWAMAALLAPIVSVLALMLVMRPNLQPRYLTPAAPAAAMAVAIGLCSVATRRAGRVAAWGTVFGLAAMTVMQKLDNRREDYRTACQEIEAIWMPGDLVFVITGTPDTFSEGTLRHYFRDDPEILAGMRHAHPSLFMLSTVARSGARLHVVYRKRSYALSDIGAFDDQCELVDWSPFRFDIQRRLYVKR